MSSTIIKSYLLRCNPETEAAIQALYARAKAAATSAGYHGTISANGVISSVLIEAAKGLQVPAQATPAAQVIPDQEAEPEETPITESTTTDEIVALLRGG